MPFAIRPPNTFLDSNGNPAVDFKVYISEPFTNPKDASKRLDITDSGNGEVVSNPFVINADGYPKNNDGQLISPVIQEQSYAILFESIGGGQQWSHENITSDAFGLTAGGSSEMVDGTFNNFPLAQSTDLTSLTVDGSGFIFIQSRDPDWEGTAAGPVSSYYSHYTGGSGAPNTGTFDLFYDSAGNEWKISDISQLPLTNQADIATNAANIATNVTNIGTNTSGVAANAAAITALEKAYKVSYVTVTDPAWIPDVDTNVIEFTVVGGGGAGADCESSSPSNSAAGSSGGGGGWGIISKSAIDATYAITVGAAGGSSSVVSVGVNVVATSGGAGQSQDEIPGDANAIGGAGGTCSGADINLEGGEGGNGVVSNGFAVSIGPSGSSAFGGSVQGGVAANGRAGNNHGAGGSGCMETGGSFNRTGGAGSAGIVVVKEFF